MVEIEEVKKHWETEVCGTRYGDDEAGWKEFFRQITENRYESEPYILEFANFPSAKNKSVLEIGVGAGTDFESWCQYGSKVSGVDLTRRAVEMTRKRLRINGIIPSENIDVKQINAERLPFDSSSYDIVYSWGVIHHTKRPKSILSEAHRVLKKGGVLKGMIYHVPSWVGLMLYLRYGLLGGRPGVSQKKVISNNLESPGTRAYTKKEGEKMLKKIGFKKVSLKTKLSPGDLMHVKLSKKYNNKLYKVIKKIYPSRVVRSLGNKYGLYLLFEAQK